MLIVQETYSDLRRGLSFLFPPSPDRAWSSSWNGNLMLCSFKLSQRVLRWSPLAGTKYHAVHLWCSLFTSIMKPGIWRGAPASAWVPPSKRGMLRTDSPRNPYSTEERGGGRERSKRLSAFCLPALWRLSASPQFGDLGEHDWVEPLLWDINTMSLFRIICCPLEHGYCF